MRHLPARKLRLSNVKRLGHIVLFFDVANVTHFRFIRFDLLFFSVRLRISAIAMRRYLRPASEPQPFNAVTYLLLYIALEHSKTKPSNNQTEQKKTHTHNTRTIETLARAIEHRCHTAHNITHTNRHTTRALDTQ